MRSDTTAAASGALLKDSGLGGKEMKQWIYLQNVHRKTAL
jgi:hypothetical protein